MRVKEILHEQRILQEQLWRFGLLLKYALTQGKDLTSAARYALSWISKSVIKNPNADEELARAWVKTVETLPESEIFEVFEAGKKAAKAAGISDNIIASAEQKASALASKSSILRSRSTWLAAQYSYAAAAAEINSILIKLNVAVPVGEMIYYIREAYRKSEEGDPEYQGKKLQWIIQTEINQCVGKVAAALVGYVGVKWILSPTGLRAFKILGWDKIGTAFNLLTPAAQAAFQAWFVSPAGADAYSRWLVGQAMLPMGKAYSEVVDIAGGLVKTGYDKILGAMGSDKADKPAPAPEPMKPFKSTLDTSTL